MRISTRHSLPIPTASSEAIIIYINSPGCVGRLDSKSLTMEGPKLPDDILWAIGGIATDLETLRALSLVSRVFVIPCQRTLFRSLVINPSSPYGYSCTWKKICSRLRDLLAHNQRLRVYVQEVHLIQGEFSYHSESWLLSDIAADILYIISSRPIRRISIVFGETSRRWADLSTTFHHALNRILLNQQFRHLTLVNIDSIPRHLPSRFPNIRSLTSQSVSFSRLPVGNDWVNILPPSGLRHLHLVCGGQPGRIHSLDQLDPIQNLDMDGIRSLTLSIPDTPTRNLYFSPFLQLRHLKALHLHFSHSPRYPFASTSPFSCDDYIEETIISTCR